MALNGESVTGVPLSITLKKEPKAMTLTIELPDNLSAALKAQASANGISEADFARKVLEQFLKPALTPAADEKVISGESKPRRPLCARIREIWADMPDDVRAKFPADGASQHDHYIYGVPKRD
jgi:plasmid stability protein